METKLRIINQLGLHARAAAKFVNTAKSFSCNVQLGTEEKMVDGKSIMGVMLLAAGKDTELRLVTQGSDEIEAATAISDLVTARFGEAD